MVLLNSVKIVAWVVEGQLLFWRACCLGICRYEFRLKKLLFLSTYFDDAPVSGDHAVSVSGAEMLSLLDSLWAIILPGAFSTFPVFVLYNFFRAIPESIMESARIDGASEFQIFFKIGIPLGKTGIIAALLLQFLEYWNVVEQPLIFLDREELWPLTLYLPEISLENAGQSLVAAVITLVPTMILFFLCKDHLEKGIVASAVKE